MSAPARPQHKLPRWFTAVLVMSAIWLGVALVRGLTYALTHAAHGG